MFKPSKKNLRFDIVTMPDCISIEAAVMYNEIPYHVRTELTLQQIYEIGLIGINVAVVLVPKLINELIHISKMRGRDQYILLHHPTSREIIEEFLEVFSERISKYKDKK